MTRNKYKTSNVQVVFKRSATENGIVKACPSFLQYNPSPIFKSKWSQLYGYVMQRNLKLSLKHHREIFTLSDGQDIALDWYGDKQSDLPIVVYFHGVCESGRDNISLFRSLNNLGYRVVVFNRRGHGGIALKVPKFCICGHGEDVDEAVCYIESQNPKAHMYAIGNSAGSGELVLYLGNYANQSPIISAVGISPAYDIEVGLKRMNQLFSYSLAIASKRYHLMQNFKITMQKPRAFFRAIIAPSFHDFHESLWEYAGYESREDYLNAINPIKLANKLKIPVLALNSADDIICSHQNIDFELFKTSPLKFLLYTQYGSHCGFYENKSCLTDRRWLSTVIDEFFKACQSIAI